jgi:hypothetical protein
MGFERIYLPMANKIKNTDGKDLHKFTQIFCGGGMVECNGNVDGFLFAGGK